MKYFFTAFLFLSFASGFGQDNTAPKEDAKLIKEKEAEVNSEIENPDVLTRVDVQAVPPGGMDTFRKYIVQKFQLPDVEKTTRATLLIRFIVWDDGSIRNVKILKETPANLGLGEQAISIFSRSAKWTPAEEKGRKVKQFYVFPISFEMTGFE